MVLMMVNGVFKHSGIGRRLTVFGNSCVKGKFKQRKSPLKGNIQWNNSLNENEIQNQILRDEIDEELLPWWSVGAMLGYALLENVTIPLRLDFWIWRMLLGQFVSIQDKGFEGNEILNSMRQVIEVEGGGEQLMTNFVISIEKEDDKEKYLEKEKEKEKIKGKQRQKMKKNEKIKEMEKIKKKEVKKEKENLKRKESQKLKLIQKEKDKKKKEKTKQLDKGKKKEKVKIINKQQAPIPQNQASHIQVPLEAGGEEEEVTEENKTRYVELYAKRWIFGSIQAQLQIIAIIKGFQQVLPVDFLFSDHLIFQRKIDSKFKSNQWQSKHSKKDKNNYNNNNYNQQEQAFVYEEHIGAAPITPQDMDIIIAGEQDIDVNDWEKNTLYEQCSQNSDQQKLWFWEIVREQLSSEQQGSLLQFVTGMRTVPIGGFAHLGPHNSQQQFCIKL
ncbi:MAG: hypothetical protein EZS28_015017 [Streblomastix strix]|uniref:HECT-type E3 ubiquitin transferase n=1 Tax=Streblomastix strix TaxID=222440 RepID=A0A5J4W4U0_9EUKA|nr:MAG: hypothetical protein EZS28_015017 [Streblomastix strix]